MRAAKVQASLCIRAFSPEPPLLAHTSTESRGTFRQKARSLAPLNGWTCAVTICHDGMLEDTNSLDSAHLKKYLIVSNNINTNLNIPNLKRDKPVFKFCLHLGPVKRILSSSIPSWQIFTAHAQPFRGARDLVFCLKVPLASLLVWASSEGSGETARMRRLAWTFAARHRL